jgi:hypothetical protein
MKIGLFSVIEWSFLDQRPQVMAKSLANWGHDVVYFEPFFRLKHWHSNEPHPWNEYENLCWKSKYIHPRLNAVTLLSLPEHNLLDEIMHFNNIYKKRNIEYIKSLKLDFVIVVDPFWGAILDEIGIPYIYDHVDDTHQMGHVIKEKWFNAQNYCEKNALAVMYIQPNLARRNNGLYVSNGIDMKQLDVSDPQDINFDCGCLSTIADWFDMNSVLNSKKKLLIIGPMESIEQKEYEIYRASGGKNVTWIPRVSRNVGAHWLRRCRSAMVPFNDLHPIVDYVMPLKLVEYIYLGLPPISYLNKGIEEEFGDFVTFYSSTGWRGLPSLDLAIEIAIEHQISREIMRDFAKKFTWDKVLSPLRLLLSEISTDNSLSIRGIVHEFTSRHKVSLLSRS